MQERVNLCFTLPIISCILAEQFDQKSRAVKDTEDARRMKRLGPSQSCAASQP